MFVVFGAVQANDAFSGCNGCAVPYMNACWDTRQVFEADPILCNTWLNPFATGCDVHCSSGGSCQAGHWETEYYAVSCSTGEAL